MNVELASGGEWTSTDVGVLAGAAVHCLLKIEEDHLANPNSERLASKNSLKTYLAHLVDPEYAMPVGEDKKFADYLWANHPERYHEINAPLEKEFSS